LLDFCHHIVLGEFVTFEGLNERQNSCHKGSNIIRIKQLHIERLKLGQTPKIWVIIIET